GLYARATAARPVAAPGTTVEVTLELVARTLPITVQRVELPGASPLTAARPLAVGKREKLALSVSLPASAPPSTAYWLARPATPGHYEVADARQIGIARQPPALEAAVDVAIAGRTVRLALPVLHAWVDPVRGERTRPFA